MEAKPLRIVPSSHNNTSGSGPQKKMQMGHSHKMEGAGVVDEEGKRVVVVVVKEEIGNNNSNSSSTTVELDLGVAVDAAHYSAPQAEPVITARHIHKCCLFTEAQRRELDHQVFIFNHFAYNLPLPHHHLLHFPTNNMSEYNRLGFDYGTMVDPEPHRCRRTDGKKWRCSKSTVPDQKYCERHMHRGRNRSRKPVETCLVNSPLTTKPCGKSLTTKLAPKSPNPLAIQHSDTSASTPSRSFCIANSTSSANNRSRNVIGSSADYHTSFSAATVATAVAPKVTTFSSMASISSDNRSRLNACKKDEHTKSCISNNMSVKSSWKGSIICDSTGVGFSPRSVLQVSGCNRSYLNDRNSIEPEPGRCRRTDGKKWRCKSAVIPGQKYCATHMHRGAKKRFTNHEPAVTAAATTPSSAVSIARLPHPSSAATSIQKGYCRIPNTSLSMSVPASAAPFIQCDEKSPSSSDTDTTITDTMNECSYVSF